VHSADRRTGWGKPLLNPGRRESIEHIAPARDDVDRNVPRGAYADTSAGG
jgi:hypothetical protein